MAGKSMDVYLNDHLAGSTLGLDLAKQIESHGAGTPLGEVMATLVPQIEEDREALIDLMDRLDASENPVKQATAWVTEKASRLKFSGLSSGDAEVGIFMALESLTLGVAGKLSLWTVLKDVAPNHPQLATVDLDRLIERARSQHHTLETERMAAGQRALTE